jgi:hypothetical protein
MAGPQLPPAAAAIRAWADEWLTLMAVQAAGRSDRRASMTTGEVDSRGRPMALVVSIVPGRYGRPPSTVYTYGRRIDRHGAVMVLAQRRQRELSKAKGA